EVHRARSQDLVPVLQSNHFFEAPRVQAHTQALLREAEAERRIAEHVARQRARRRLQLRVGYDAGDETHPLGARGVDEVPGEQQLGGDRGADVARAFRSRPAQKARPAPRMTTTRVSASSASPQKNARSSRTSAAFMALSDAGRSSVSQVRCPSRSTSSVSKRSCGSMTRTVARTTARMRIRRTHRWDLSVEEALRLQHRLAPAVDTGARLGRMRLVAGADAAYHQDGERLVAAVVVLALPGLEVVEEASVEGRVG